MERKEQQNMVSLNNNNIVLLSLEYLTQFYQITREVIDTDVLDFCTVIHCKIEIHDITALFINLRL